MVLKRIKIVKRIITLYRYGNGVKERIYDYGKSKGAATGFIYVLFIAIMKSCVY